MMRSHQLFYLALVLWSREQEDLATETVLLPVPVFAFTNSMKRTPSVSPRVWLHKALGHHTVAISRSHSSWLLPTARVPILIASNRKISFHQVSFVNVETLVRRLSSLGDSDTHFLYETLREFHQTMAWWAGLICLCDTKQNEKCTFILSWSFRFYWYPSDFFVVKVSLLKQ